MTLADLTALTLIVPELRAREVPAVIQELAQELYHDGCIHDLAAFTEAVLKREAVVSTAMEEGMGFPHARVAGLDRLSFALGRSKEGLVWGAPTAPRVRLVFLMAVPAMDTAQYLALISGLARLSKESALMAKLHAAADPAQILQVLDEVTLRGGPSAGSGKRRAR